MLKRSIAALFAFIAIMCMRPAHADLAAYLHEPDSNYKWELLSTERENGVTVYRLSMVSQIWHGITWTHHLSLYKPDTLKYPDFCALFNTGGDGKGEAALGPMMANRTGAYFAILANEPNQPLFGGKTEDALVVYTWQKYLETSDETWLLHWAMTRAIMRGLDTIQSLTGQQHLAPIKRFLISGASKRGWNTWLAGASKDKRIVAIAPMVIDTLHVDAQIPHELEAYGQPSEQVQDYTGAGMLKLLNTPPGKELLAREDPYSYLNVLTLPKLLILGTNDRYWSQDALNIYWGDLKGPKWVTYTPNSGHGLEDRLHVYATMSAYIHTIAAHHAWPHIQWSYAPNDTGSALTITSNVPIASARIYHVEASTQDFRDSKWSSDPITGTEYQYTGTIDKPATGWRAAFGEVTYNLDGFEFTLSTQMKIQQSK